MKIKLYDVKKFKNVDIFGPMEAPYQYAQVENDSEELAGGTRVQKTMK